MDNKKKHIGVIGSKDHSKMTLAYAISLLEKNEIDKEEDYSYAKEIKIEEYVPEEEKPKVKKIDYKVNKK